MGKKLPFTKDDYEKMLENKLAATKPVDRQALLQKLLATGKGTPPA